MSHLLLPVNEGVDQVILSELPEDADDILDLLRMEIVPLKYWYLLLAEYAKKSDMVNCQKILDAGVDPDIQTVGEYSKEIKDQIGLLVAASGSLCQEALDSYHNHSIIPHGHNNHGHGHTHAGSSSEPSHHSSLASLERARDLISRADSLSVLDARNWVAKGWFYLTTYQVKTQNIEDLNKSLKEFQYAIDDANLAKPTGSTDLQTALSWALAARSGKATCLNLLGNFKEALHEWRYVMKRTGSEACPTAARSGIAFSTAASIGSQGYRIVLDALEAEASALFLNSNDDTSNVTLLGNSILLSLTWVSPYLEKHPEALRECQSIMKIIEKANREEFSTAEDITGGSIARDALLGSLTSRTDSPASLALLAAHLLVRASKSTSVTDRRVLYDQAMRICENALTRATGYIRKILCVLLGNSLQGLSKWEEAFKVFSDCLTGLGSESNVQTNSWGYAARWGHAQCAAVLGKWDIANQSIEHVRAKFGDQLDVLKVQGLINSKQASGSFYQLISRAKAALGGEEALEQDPLLLALLGNIAMQESDWFNAQKFFFKLLKSQDQSNSSAAEYISINKISLVIVVAVLLAENSQIEDAELILKDLIKRHSISSSQSPRRSVLNDLADSSVNQTMEVLSFVKETTLPKITSEEVDIIEYNLGCFGLMAGNVEKADYYFNKVAERCEHKPTSIASLSACLKSPLSTHNQPIDSNDDLAFIHNIQQKLTSIPKSLLSGALTEAIKAIQKRRESDESYMNDSYSLCFMGELYYQKALTIDTHSAAPNDRQVNFALTDSTKDEDKHLHSALKYFSRALQANPNNYTAVTGVAAVLSHLGRKAQSIELLKSLADVKGPGEPAVLLSLGHWYLQEAVNASSQNFNNKKDDGEGFRRAIKAYEVALKALNNNPQHQTGDHSAVLEGPAHVRHGLLKSKYVSSSLFYDILSSLGSAQFMASRFEESVETYSNLSSIYPEHLGVKYNLAVSLENAGGAVLIDKSKQSDLNKVEDAVRFLKSGAGVAQGLINSLNSVALNAALKLFESKQSHDNEGVESSEDKPYVAENVLSSMFPYLTINACHSLAQKISGKSDGGSLWISTVNKAASSIQSLDQSAYLSISLPLSALEEHLEYCKTTVDSAEDWLSKLRVTKQTETEKLLEAEKRRREKEEADRIKAEQQLEYERQRREQAEKEAEDKMESFREEERQRRNRIAKLSQSDYNEDESSPKNSSQSPNQVSGQKRKRKPAGSKPAKTRVQRNKRRSKDSGSESSSDSSSSSSSSSSSGSSSASSSDSSSDESTTKSPVVGKKLKFKIDESPKNEEEANLKKRKKILVEDDEDDMMAELFGE